MANHFFTDYINEVKERGYFGKCYVPHDISVKSFESGRTRIQTLVGAGLNPIPVPLHSVPDRINASQLTIPRCRFNCAKCAQGLSGLREYCRDWDDRLQLTIPRCRFNCAKCAQGLSGLREYCRDWDDRLKVFKDQPKHNWASHAADAFGYMAEADNKTGTDAATATVQTAEFNELR